MGLLAATSLRGENSASEIIELEAFIVEETAQTQIETLSPLTMRLDSLFGPDRTVLDVPRSVSVLSPELRDLLQIDSYDSLDRFGAGTQRVNYFGLAGSAFLRGARAGTYFNGMLRAYQRNEMPMSFGSLDGLEVIKGPVPASFSPTLVGGAVNQRPKSPFFDKARGSVQLELGSFNHLELQVDYGGPLLLLGKPAAWRFSYTSHRADRYYKDVPEDFDSLYLTTKIKLNERNRLTIGGEYYDFRSSEIPGINRPTAELISDGRYVIGEPPSLTSAQWGGQVVRRVLEFPYSLSVNPALFALAVPGDLARASFTPEQLGTMLNLNDSAVLESLYAPVPREQVPGFAAWGYDDAVAFLGQVDVAPQDAYLYTPEFFAAGGEALTVQLPRDRVLADPADVANSIDWIAFADLETRLRDDRRLLSRLFVEHLETTKASTYGFAFNSEQLVAQGRVELQVDLDARGSYLSLGGDLRFTRAEVLQDFDAEPFSRRDLSRDSISANTVVPAGATLGPDGLNFWSTFGTASLESDLFQAALFVMGDWMPVERLTVHYGARLENGWYSGGLPGELDRVSDAARAARNFDGEELLWQVHLNPVFEIRPGLNAYAAAQFGRALAPGDGGTVSGPETFTDVELLEVGLKAGSADGSLYSALSYYQWEQSTYSTRDASARPLKASGLEWELSWAPTDYLSLLAAFTAQRVTLEQNVLGFGALPLDEAGWALNGGILNATGGRSAPANPDMVFAGMPEVSGHLYAVLELPAGWQVSAGPLWRRSYYHDMQRALEIPGSVVWSAQLRYEAESWWVRLHVENLFDRAYWIGQEPVFSASTLILQGPGRSWQLSAGYRF